ncbi:MAG TPA: hypothetical protein VJ697_13540 [Nitrososphaeraceae archaeon]|nr:hypothetical protein [Nitrososphaeraceae archaeon]
MESNTFYLKRNTFDPFTKEIVNYINYELNYFHVISQKRFFVQYCDETGEVELWRFCTHNEDKNLDYIIVFRSNNLNHFFKNLFEVRGFLVRKSKFERVN